MRLAGQLRREQDAVALDDVIASFGLPHELDELIAERAQDDPDFPELVEEALRAREEGETERPG